MSFYITTPIYYVNARRISATLTRRSPLTCSPATSASEARTCSSSPAPTSTVSRSPTQRAPRALTPQELADRNAERFQALLPKLESSNDFFIRTTDPEHKRRVQEVLERVHDNGHVYKGLYEGWYCPRCADFKVENEILEGNRCPIHEIVLERHQEENWFFRLSTFQEPLERLYAERTDFVMPQRHYNEALSFINSGLQDISLSRHG